MILERRLLKKKNNFRVQKNGGGGGGGQYSGVQGLRGRTVPLMRSISEQSSAPAATIIRDLRGSRPLFMRNP